MIFMKPLKNMNESNNMNPNFFSNIYNMLLKLANIFKNSDNKKRLKMFLDMLLLLIITCIFKIPFIFIRDIGDNCIRIFFNNNLNTLMLWGLIIELLYIIVALAFFLRTLRKWVDGLE